ncbi:MAG: hypothetical protein BWY57_02499 [Betaproteobacteria bacterium ADurb.Bin341]|nr:MAG: hypothetical protein BWY57_02499 [Betaproteobacteria bacterium ADurb.Bin341]
MGIDFEDAVHTFHVEDDAALDRNHLPAHAGTGAARNDRDLFAIGVAQQFLYLRRVLRPDDGLRHGLMHGGVGAVHIKIGRIVADVFRTDNFFQFRTIYRVHRSTIGKDIVGITGIWVAVQAAIPASIAAAVHQVNPDTARDIRTGRG